MQSRKSSPRSEGTDNPKSSSTAGSKKWQSSREIIIITVYFVILLALFLGYKIWLFITNYRIHKAIYETDESHQRIEPYRSALLEAIPGLVPVVLYVLLLPSMLGARLYDYLTNQHRGPRRRLFIMTVVLLVSGVCLTIQIITYVFRSTLTYLSQIPEVVTCYCRHPAAKMEMMSSSDAYLCECYIPGHGDQKLFMSDPLHQINNQNLAQLGLDNPYNIALNQPNVTVMRDGNETRGDVESLQLMGTYYQMLPFMKSMVSLLQIYIVLVAIRLPIYIMINNYKESLPELDEEQDSGFDPPVARQRSEDSAGYKVPAQRVSSIESHNYEQITELKRLTRALKRLSTIRHHTMFAPPIFLADEVVPEVTEPTGNDTISREAARNKTTSPVLQFMFPVFKYPSADGSDNQVTDEELKKARKAVQSLKRGVMIQFAIEICYHGFVEIVDAYSLCDEIIQNPDYFKSNMPLTYATLTSLAVTLLVFSIGNFFVTHPGKSVLVNRVLKAALLTVNNLPAFVIRCYLFWGYQTLDAMSGQLGSVFLLFTIKEIAVLILGLAELITTWRTDKQGLHAH